MLQIVTNKYPPTIRVGLDDVLNVLQKIHFRSRLIQHRRDDLACRDIFVAEQTRRAMTFVIILATFHLARLHWLRFGLALQRLNAGLLIDTHRVNAVRFVFCSVKIRFANFFDFLFKLLRVFFFFAGLQVIPTFVRLQVGFLLKKTTPFERRCARRCRV